jgi:hypothetical protein
MPGVKRCGIKVNPDGTLNPEGKPCALKEGHDLATIPHKPRTAIVIDDNAIKLMSATVAVVTDESQLTEAKRTRTVSDSPLGQLAMAVVKGGHDAWVRGGKHPITAWEKTPTIALDAVADIETKLRGEIHRAAAVQNWKVNFGDSKVLTEPVMKDGKPVMKDGQPVTKPTGLVKMFFQVRDIPVKPDAKPDVKADDTKSAVVAPNAGPPSAPSARERLAKA